MCLRASRFKSGWKYMLKYYLKRAKKTRTKLTFPEFTGKSTLIVNLHGHGPMIIRIDDRNVTTALVATFLDHVNGDLNVKEYEPEDDVIAMLNV